MLNYDYIVEFAVWVIGAVLLLTLVPKAKIREAWISFLFMLLLSTVFGLLVVEFELIQYPSRLFARAINSSFTFEFFAFPVISVIYNLHYPDRFKLWMRLGYMLFFPAVLSVTELWLERHTNVIKYIHWSWYWSFVTLLLTLQASLLLYRWFCRYPCFRVM
ncbi:CBO0543 family protein [Paenibacillus solisilvae]|uniref:CBO0543 family protein n=1 Tax=Paenibacillus solisilvae TaxID=2486751 RepID=A0ABW0VZM5_9BACL